MNDGPIRGPVRPNMTDALFDLASLLLAVGFAAAGGEMFLRGVLGTANLLLVPRMLVAVTLAAFATSSPEFTVSTVAAMAGHPEIGLGDALGSNVVNIALIFGIALLFGPVRASRRELGRDFAMALGVPVATLALAANDGISRAEGGLFIAIFLAWLAAVVRDGMRARRRAEAAAIPLGALLKTWLIGLAGLTALIIAGRLFVSGASGLAALLGLPTYVIGALIVAVGTSLPELVTVVLSRWRAHDDIGLGTLIGSNLFNGLAIVGTAAVLHPIRAPFSEVAVSLGAGVLALLLVIPTRDGQIRRARGPCLLLIYLAFVSLTLGIGAG